MVLKFLFLTALSLCCVVEAHDDKGRSLHHNLNVFDYVNAPPPSTPFRCPLPNRIAPCTCNANERSGTCNGTRISQERIDNFMKQLRQTNRVKTSGWFAMTRFDIYETDLSTIAIDSFSKMNFTLLTIWGNHNLEKFTFGNSRMSLGDAPTVDPFYRASGMFIGNNSLTDDGITNLFTPLDRPFLSVLLLNNNQLEGTNPELIPGLQDMTGLLWLSLDNNKITSIGNAQFDKNQNIILLSLTNNGLNTLGEDAFTFKRESCVVGNTTIVLYLSNNNLGGNVQDRDVPSRSNIHDTAFSGITRTAFVDMCQNNLETITAPQFQTFLNNSKKNMLFLHKNQFVCDQRLRWLKQQRKQYEKQVSGVSCTNDEGQTAFTSSKV